MDEAVARKLVTLNEAFYERFAAPFAASRAAPQPGFARLLAHWPAPSSPSAPPLRVLDVGCGDGRLGRYLHDRDRAIDYTGVDFSAPLLAVGAAGQFVRRDLSRPGALAGLGRYDWVVCLSTLQHIPGRDRRVGLLVEMRDCLRPGGRLALTNWQFLDSPRQRRKLRPWAEVGLATSDVEPGDYLLAWQRGGYGLRYVALLDAAATAALAEAAGLVVLDQFRSDGREGDLNLYTILAAAG
jgi:SAM-dependent methyltransferase